MMASMDEGETIMAMTAKERVRAVRERRRRRMLVLSVEVHEDDLREIALRGYEDAATTDRRRQAEAVSLFISDTLYG